MKFFKFTGFGKPNVNDTWELTENIYFGVDSEILDKVLNEGIIRFESTVDDINRTKDKAFRLLTVFISLLSILIALYYNDYLTTNYVDRIGFKFVFSVGLIILAISIIQLISIINPAQIKLKGEDIKELTSNFAEFSKHEKEVQLNSYKRDSFKVVQDKISYNEYLLEIMNDKIENVITTTSFVFIVTLFLSLWLIK